MEIRTTVSNLTKHVSVEKIRNVNHETFRIDEYKEMFLGLNQRGVIVNGDFEDSQWSLFNDIADSPITLIFDIEIYAKLNTALKSYSVLRLVAGRRPLTIYNEIALLKKVILDSKGLINVKRIEALFEEQSRFASQGNSIVDSTKKFVTFYKTANSNLILDLCKSRPKKNHKIRELPSFQDVMIFDDIVNHYFRNKTSDETLEYLPIFMWWFLTNTLPMRPSEFLLIEKNCLKYDLEKSMPYSIEVPRIKNEANNPDFIIRYDTISIDQNTYNIISEAIKKIEEFGNKSKYLFTIEILKAFRKTKRRKKNQRINLRDFTLLKKQFYLKVVEDIYSEYNLERVKSGDTRHFAIINMCLQGFNMLSIAQMSGHDDVESNYSYFTHAEHFAQSYVYRLAQKKIENQVNFEMNGAIVGWKRYIYDSGNLSNPKNYPSDIVGRVKYGDCTDSIVHFPKNCIEYCEFCPKFVFNPSINENKEAIRWLNENSMTLEVKIRESIEIMKEISTNLKNSLRIANNDVLGATSKKLLTYMDMKATIDAKLMEANSFGPNRKSE